MIAVPATVDECLFAHACMRVCARSIHARACAFVSPQESHRAALWAQVGLVETLCITLMIGNAVDYALHFGVACCRCTSVATAAGIESAQPNRPRCRTAVLRARRHGITHVHACRGLAWHRWHRRYVDLHQDLPATIRLIGPTIFGTLVAHCRSHLCAQSHCGLDCVPSASRTAQCQRSK